MREYGGNRRNNMRNSRDYDDYADDVREEGADGPDGVGEAGEKRVSVVREVLDWVKHFAIAIIVGILFINFVGQRTEVYGMSMTPTLQNGDQLVIEKITPRFGTIKRGDIVTIYVHGLVGEGKDYLIKRVIAVAGDTVRIEDGKVYVNGGAIEENYINGDYTYEERLTHEITVSEGQVFVMGDNRHKGGSNDSRSLGQFEVKQIGGKAIFRWYPFKTAGPL